MSPGTSSEIALGESIPPHTPHAVSVSLPTWKDNVDYELGLSRVHEVMATGYPRFFIHRSIRELASICEKKFANKEESCMLFPTKKIAEACCAFVETRSVSDGYPVSSRLEHFLIVSENGEHKRRLADAKQTGTNNAGTSVDLYIVIFPALAFPIAKQFWQHAGLGISSRLAEHCLTLFQNKATVSPPPSPKANRPAGKSLNRHYSVNATAKTPSPKESSHLPAFVDKQREDDYGVEHATYLEERYGRNMPVSRALDAKRALRRRIAGVLLHDTADEAERAGAEDITLGPSSRGSNVSEDDVYLYPSGMAAIWTAHSLALSVRPQAKSVCFGFPYTDTLKVLEKWGPGCYFLGYGVDTDIDELERILADEAARDPSKPPVLALFTEFPSNPLLRSANLPRLRALADQYDFLIVVDETIGNFVNVQVLPYADIVVSSLTKVFSGDCNVMGGSMTLNPQGRHYSTLKKWLDNNYEDSYFSQDAIFLERNSRDFKRRIRAIDSNTEAVCDLLRAHSIAGGATNAVIKEVFYPKFITREHYDHCRIKDSASGFGGLFSLTFTSKSASEAFFDNLRCCKGPSLGTNFTIASPFTILAHFTELEWAARYGVEEGLVRISIGMEEREVLLDIFRDAVKKVTEGHAK